MSNTRNSKLGSQPSQTLEHSSGAAAEYAKSAWPLEQKEKRGRPHNLLLGSIKRGNPAALCVSKERGGGPDPATDLATRQSSKRGVRQMKKQMFEELLGSVREAGA